MHPYYKRLLWTRVLIFYYASSVSVYVAVVVIFILVFTQPKYLNNVTNLQMIARFCAHNFKRYFK